MVTGGPFLTGSAAGKIYTTRSENRWRDQEARSAKCERDRWIEVLGARQ